MDLLSSVAKPRFRGRLHQLAFFVSIPAGITLVMLARGAEARVGAAIFAASMAGLYGASALYHRGRWSERARWAMRRLDHAMIFVLIAGTYTPVVLLALRPAWGITFLVMAWVGATVGILVSVLRLERWPKTGHVLYIVLGWLAVLAGPQLVRSLSGIEMALLVGGGLLYTVGAVILTSRRPDPRPAVFGYHEVWHTLVVGANASHFALVLLLVRP